MDITKHLLAKNSHLIESTLKSILPLGGNIIAGDIQSDEESLKICRKYGAKIISLPELSFVGQPIQNTRQAVDLSQPIEGYQTQQFKNIAKNFNCYI